MSVIENNKIYYIQHVDTQCYISLPKKQTAGSACVAMLKDEKRYYQRWHVKMIEDKDTVQRFGKPYVITEATTMKFSLGSKCTQDSEPVFAQDVEDAKGWIVQDRAAKMEADKWKARADRKKAAKTKDADKEDTSEREDNSDKEDTSNKEDTSGEDGTSNQVTAYTILKRHLKGNTTKVFNWVVLKPSEWPAAVTLLSNSGMPKWKFVEVEEDVKVEEDAAAA